MKKAISLLLALALLLSGAAYAADTLFSMNTESEDQGVTVTVTLHEDVTAENATVLQGELYYDPAQLAPVSVESGEGFGFLTCLMSTREPRVQFGCVSETGDALSLNAGTVITAEFEALIEGDAGLRLEMDLQTADGTVVADLTEFASVTVEPARENPFTDVPEGSFYYEPVLWAVENGITSGATETTFNPGGALLRAQVVVMLWSAAGQPEPVGTENPFTDVKEGAFYYKAVLWALENGITGGTSATTFSPAGVTNRAQVVTFLWNFMGKPEAGTHNPFGDVDADAWYGKPVLWAVENGVTSGMSETMFGVGSNCVRAHMVTFLYSALT